MILDIPHVTQLYNGVRNDCMQADLLGLARYYSGSTLTLDEFCEIIGLDDDTFTSIGEVCNTTMDKLLLDKFNFNLDYTYQANLDWYEIQLAKGLPAIALVSYLVLNPPAKINVNHFVTVIGMDQLYVYIHDPLRTTGATPVPRLQFLDAITKVAPHTTAIYPKEIRPMLKGLGLNIHGDYLDNYELLKSRLQAAPPPALLVMDNLPRALELKALLPTTTHIYRHFRDTSDFRTTSPEEWIAMHEYAGGRGLWLQADNEAPLSADFAAWSLRVAQLCVARQWQVCLLNLGVGHPDVTTDEWRLADTLLRYIASNPKYCMVGLHEYSNSLVSYDFGKETDPAKFPAVSIDARPWLLGRFRHLLAYCKSKGIKAPKIVINEWGFDTVPTPDKWQEGIPGYQKEMGYQSCRPAWQSWQPGLSAAQYAFKQLQWAWTQIYKPHPEIIGVCYFCYGGVGSWNTIYSIHRENELFDLIRTQGDFSLATVTTPPPPPPTPGTKRIYIEGSEWVNARADHSASSTDVGNIIDGTPLHNVLAFHWDGKYIWNQVDITLAGKRMTCWMATIGDSWDIQIR